MSALSGASRRPTLGSDDFPQRLIAWQLKHGRRDLPWQGTRDAYRIWIAEVMLQQTQVAAARGYYTRFLARFPDLQTLAGASLDEVLAMWSGLGYYRRARMLHACAIEVQHRHAGRFPQDPAILQKLPGIGRSTAAAIAVFTYDKRAAILDGNVRRVLSRFFALESGPRPAQTERELWALAESLVSTLPDDTGDAKGNEGLGWCERSESVKPSAIATYTQALMDLGATRCTPRRPLCSECPLAIACKAYRGGEVTRYPQVAPRPFLATRRWVLLLVQWQGQILLEKRPERGIWASLWSLPELHFNALPPGAAGFALVDSDGPDRDPTQARVVVRHWLLERGLISEKDVGFKLSQTIVVEQGFSHFRLSAPLWEIELACESFNPGAFRAQEAMEPDRSPGSATGFAAEPDLGYSRRSARSSATLRRWVQAPEALAMGIPAVLRKLLLAKTGGHAAVPTSQP